MKQFNRAAMLLLLAALIVTAYLIFTTYQAKRTIKEDLVELSNIKYGLFNVDEWKKMLANVLTKKIDEFELSGKNRKEMKKKISDFLYKIISDLEQRYYEENSKGFWGSLSLKNIGARYFGVFDKMKRDVPVFTNEILNFMNDGKTKKALRSYLIGKLNEYADDTFAKMDYSVRDSIITRYQVKDRPEAIAVLQEKQDKLQTETNYYKYALLLIALLASVVVLITKTLSKTELQLLTFLSFIFLILGLLLPMIEIDARVSEISLTLLGEQFNFQDQVLYYKSKSILEVVSLMITRGDFDLLLVGVLVLMFSVLFPISKLICTLLVTSRPKMGSHKVVNFMVNKTGKWSMADVMVVAIFMSYLGFSGILTEQLKQIEHLSQKIDVITTNKSSLQAGFYAFTSFTILSLLTTSKLRTASQVQPQME